LAASGVIVPAIKASMVPPRRSSMRAIVSGGGLYFVVAHCGS
jgi:hypothetical protein